MLLRIEEVVTLEFTSIEIIPGERRCHAASTVRMSFLTTVLSIPTGAYVEVRLKTRKSAQTGVLHTWRLWANDADPRLCPVRALIHLGCLYGLHVPLKGPLFLRVGKLGDILHDQPVVCGSLNDIHTHMP